MSTFLDTQVGLYIYPHLPDQVTFRSLRTRLCASEFWTLTVAPNALPSPTLTPILTMKDSLVLWYHSFPQVPLLSLLKVLAPRTFPLRSLLHRLLAVLLRPSQGSCTFVGWQFQRVGLSGSR